MKVRQALTGILVVLVLLAAMIAGQAGLVTLGRASLFIPSPENVADGLVEALAAHRYEGALNQLSEDLKQQVSDEDLQEMVKAIEASQQGIQDAQEEGSQELGNKASASLKVKLGNNQEQQVDLPLVKENGLWKVASLDPLWGLSQ